jgi:hypothetical protein
VARNCCKARYQRCNGTDSANYRHGLSRRTQEVSVSHARYHYVLHNTADVVLVFPKPAGSLRLLCYADASFAGNVGHNSQLGFLLLLFDSANNAHILNWFICKSSRIPVSILKAETLACTAAVDVAYEMRLQLAQMGIDAEMDVLKESKLLYIELQGHKIVTEKRLMTDVADIRQDLRKKEVTRVGFVRSQYNLADGLTKPLQLSKDSALTSVLRTARHRFVFEEFIPQEFLPISQLRAQPVILPDSTTSKFC